MSARAIACPLPGRRATCASARLNGDTKRPVVAVATSSRRVWRSAGIDAAGVQV